jgi:histidinol-phosphate aminotransferase
MPNPQPAAARRNGRPKVPKSVVNPGELRLDQNENTGGCSARVLARLRSLSGQEVASYPERSVYEPLIASHLGMKPEEVMLTNGADEGIHLLCELYLNPKLDTILPVPSFGMYRHYAMATDANIVEVPMTRDFSFPTRDVLAKITSKTGLIFIGNPNNPTGTTVPREDIFRILETAAQVAPKSAVLVDEAYFEFYGQTLLPELRRFPNLHITRTFSKAYGMAGLRVGVLIANVEAMRRLQRISSPFSVNTIALTILPIALADQGFVRSYISNVKRQRAVLEKALEKIGLRYWPSQANFLLVEIGEGRAAFLQEMAKEGIFLRDRGSDHLCEGCVRITVGNPQEMERVIRTMPKALKRIGWRREAWA